MKYTFLDLFNFFLDFIFFSSSCLLHTTSLSLVSLNNNEIVLMKLSMIFFFSLYRIKKLLLLE